MSTRRFMMDFLETKFLRMASFHDASRPEALSIVQSLDDERLKVFGLRLIYFGARSILPDNVRLQIERDLTDRLIRDTGAGLTFHQALQETDALLEGSPDDAEGILIDYRSYLINRIRRVQEFRSKQLPQWISDDLSSVERSQGAFDLTAEVYSSCPAFPKWLAVIGSAICRIMTAASV